MNPPVRLPVATLTLFATLTSAAWAQTWDGGGGTDTNWSTAANWVDDTVPTFSSNPSVTLTGATNYASNADSAATLTKLTFSPTGGNATLTGETLTFLAGGGGTTPLILVSGSGKGNVVIDNHLRLLGTGSINATTRNLTLNGNLALTSGQVQLNANATQSITVNGVISGVATTLAFTGHTNGNGRIYINANNTYTGDTAIWTGGVVIGVDASTAGGAFGASATAVALGFSSGALFAPTLLTGAAVTVARDVRVVTNTTGTTTAALGGNSAHASVFSGAITLGSDNAASIGLSLTAVAGGRVNLTGNLLRAGGATGSNDTITKKGVGIVAIEGAGNTYAGATTVEAGTLLINGTLASGGAAVSALGGATLGGAGTINRDVSVAGGATFSPGDMNAGAVSQAGTLAIEGNLAFADTSILRFDLGLLSDHVAVTGDLTLDGGLNIANAGGLAPGTYALFSYTGTFLDHGLTVDSAPGGYTYVLDTSIAGQVNLQVIPEPRTLALAAGGLALAAAALRRRRPASV